MLDGAESVGPHPLKGGQLSTRADGLLVDEMPLESIHPREFAFFSFATESQPRSRNVIYRGQWPG